MDRVVFEGVSKCYRLGARSTARESLVSATGRLLGRVGAPPPEVWPLRDVNFSVGEGESLGIIGRNGAGKSTLLKVLTGITSPTLGVSRTRGRVASLLEVGTGFHPELTGRENVYLNGAILGMSRSDTARAFDAIVDFAGVGRFIDTPVKRYSSGMGLRLGFSVAAHLDPDVLIFDEILAVGDAEFQRRCLQRMQLAEREGRTVVLVSHDLDSLLRVCSSALWLDGGSVRAAGSPAAIVRQYIASTRVDAAEGGVVLRGGPVSVHAVRVIAAGAAETGTLMRGDPLTVEVDLEVHESVPGFDVSIYLSRAGGARIVDQALSDHPGADLALGRHRLRMDVPPVLNVGEHSVGLWCGRASPAEDYLDEPEAARFELHGNDQGRPGRVVVLDLPIRRELPPPSPL